VAASAAWSGFGPASAGGWAKTGVEDRWRAVLQHLLITGISLERTLNGMTGRLDPRLSLLHLALIMILRRAPARHVAQAGWRALGGFTRGPTIDRPRSVTAGVLQPKLCGKFVPGGQERGGICGQR
jgi:hypothetical protein